MTTVDTHTYGSTSTMVNHVDDVDVMPVMGSEHEATIFTMQDDSRLYPKDQHIPVPLSYSSADSVTEYASLFGEAIISKDTLFTTANNTYNTGTGGSTINTVIMMVDRCNTNGHQVVNIEKSDAITIEDVANVPANVPAVVPPTDLADEDAICTSLCSNRNHCSSNDTTTNDDMMMTTTKDDIAAASIPGVLPTTIKSSMSQRLLPPLRDGSVSPRRVEPPLFTTVPPRNSMNSTSKSSSEPQHRTNELFLDVIGCPCFQPSPLDYPFQNASSTSAKHPLLLMPSHANTTDTKLSLPKIRRLSLFDENEKKDDDDDNRNGQGNGDEEEEEEEEQFQLDEELMTGIIEETGAQYHITKIIVEGWIHKKGTGQDWLGSRGWKARWARLAIGYIDGYDNVEVPLLSISWYPTSTNNSTVIVLDSTVVLAVDLPNKDRSHRFEIRHAKSSIATTSPSKKDKKVHHPSSSTTTNDELPITRTFAAASRKARDAWVYAISQALLSYEKDKAALRKLQWRNSIHGSNHSPSPQRLPSQQQQQQASPSRNVSPNKTREYDDIWLNDRFPPSPSRSLSVSAATTTTIGTGRNDRNVSPIQDQQRIDRQRLSHSNPRPRQQSQCHPSQHALLRSSTPTSIIGQDGVSTSSGVTTTTVPENQRYYHPQQHQNNNRWSHSDKPMSIQARSTSA